MLDGTGWLVEMASIAWKYPRANGFSIYLSIYLPILTASSLEMVVFSCQAERDANSA